MLVVLVGSVSQSLFVCLSTFFFFTFTFPFTFFFSHHPPIYNHFCSLFPLIIRYPPIKPPPFWKSQSQVDPWEKKKNYNIFIIIIIYNYNTRKLQRKGLINININTKQVKKINLKPFLKLFFLSFCSCFPQTTLFKFNE